MPQFFLEVANYSIFEKLRKKDNCTGTIEEFVSLTEEIKWRLQNEVLNKSALWIELAERKNSHVQSSFAAR